MKIDNTLNYLKKTRVAISLFMLVIILSAGNLVASADGKVGGKPTGNSEQSISAQAGQSLSRVV